MRAIPFKVVIPARYASSRLPGKPLLDLGGRPMVIRVAENARQSGAEEILIATDHPAILEAAAEYGHEAILTAENHASGTDRIAEVAAFKGWPPDTLVVNAQGDEPLLPPEMINAAAYALAQSGADMATLAHPLADAAEFFNPNVVKVVCDRQGNALYFSRAPVPYARDAFAKSRETLPPDMKALRHIGLYAYRASFLHAYGRLERSPLEESESLEQLRALWHGYRIHVLEIDHPLPPGVDTPEEAERMRQRFV
ncbi:MAG: 3-deoxy-manno-octulosonate cytidylyltransferase [Betaproteobacteria bacterium]|nr:3-deoxy-manno-octulosonate cytidylyltransferase [Betaproteobacteria bacterium]